MLIPTFLIVISIVLGPLLANFWISVKPVQLGDLRSARVMVNEALRPRPKAAGEEVTLRYRVRNSSQKAEITGAGLTDTLPDGLFLSNLPDGCALAGQVITCDIGTLAPKERRDIEIKATIDQTYLDNGIRARDSSGGAMW